MCMGCGVVLVHVYKYEGSVYGRVYLRVHVCPCNHTPTCKHLYDLYLQPLACLGKHIINIRIAHLCCDILTREKL